MPLPHLPYKQLAASLVLALPVLLSFVPGSDRHPGTPRAQPLRIDVYVRQAVTGHGGGA